MLEHIVLATDGGTASAAAARWVADRGHRHQSSIDIVTVVTPGERGAARSHHAVALSSAREILAGASAVRELTRHGDVVDELVKASERADLLVVGSHRVSGLATLFDLTLPLRLADRVVRPLIVVPEQWQPRGGPVVVGWDDDGSADAAIDLAAREAAGAGRALRLVHTWVLPPMDAYDARTAEELHVQVRATERRFIEAQAARLRERHPALVVEPALTTHSPSSALAYADSAASLIVIGTHRRGSLADLLIRSVGEDLIRAASCPVAIVPPPQAPPREPQPISTGARR